MHGKSSLTPGWGRSATGLPTFIWRKPRGSITTSVRAPLWGAGLIDASFASGWEVVLGLDDLDGDVLLIALAHALARRDPDGTTWITADAILDDRGIQPKTMRVGAARYRTWHRREDRARVATCMERLGRLWVSLDSISVMEQRGGRLVRGNYDAEGDLLTIRDRLVQGDGEEELPVAWRYRFGPWLSLFLAPPNRQTALLARAVLRYDPYRERWEKRLGRYFTFHLRMDARRAAGKPLVRRLDLLFDELSFPMDQRHPERTRMRCETALDRLVHDGVIGAWTYTASARAALAALPARRWLERWRGLSISVANPRRPAL